MHIHIIPANHHLLSLVPYELLQCYTIALVLTVSV